MKESSCKFLCYLISVVNSPIIEVLWLGDQVLCCMIVFQVLPEEVHEMGSQCDGARAEAAVI